MAKLRVVKADKDDIFEDIVRISGEKRIDSRGKHIINGSICSIVVSPSGKKIRAILRGWEGGENIISIDEKLRQCLGIEVGKEYEFIFSSSIFDNLAFPWFASNPGYRISMQIAIISFILGLISVFVSIASFSTTQ